MVKNCEKSRFIIEKNRMFRNFCNENNDELFINSKFSNGIEVILPKTEFEVNFKHAGTQLRKACYLVAEKMEFQGLIQIRIFEKHDRARMFLSTIDIKFFDQLKQDQSLHVTFSGFVDNLAKLLNECQRGNLDISIMEEKKDCFFLQFYEYRQFKNLIHLSLPLKEAPMPLVLFYINRLLEDVTKENQCHEKKISHMQFQLDKKIEEIHLLQNENTRLNAEIHEREKMISLRFQEDLNKLHERIKIISEEQHLEGIKYQENLSNLQNNLEQLQMKNSKLAEEKMHEIKNVETKREEICCLKSNLANLKETNEKLHAEMAALKNLERKNEMYLKDAKHNIQELQEKIRKYEKTQYDLKAELEAEKKITTTKRHALEIATEEIEKANEIITKQGKELINMRKMLNLRTEVALNQEKAIKEKEKEIELQKQQIEQLESVIIQFREESKDFPKKLISLKNLADQLEHKYSEKLAELNNKISEQKGGGRKFFR